MAGLWRRWLGRRRGETLETLRRRYQRFQHLIEGNNRVLDLIADAGEKSGGDHVFDRHYLEWLTEELSVAVSAVVYDLNALADNRYGDLVEAFDRICQGVQAVLSPAAAGESDVILSLDNVDRDSANVVGAKMARLGELRSRLRLTVPDGFVASASACRLHFHAAGIDRLIADHGEDLRAPPGPRFEAAASRLRDAVRRTPLDPGVARALRGAIKEPARSEWTYAVRSSALDEDGAHSFAGLHHTLLNVPPSNVADAYRDVLASLFSSQALRYRVENGLPVAEALMAVGFLAMVPARASGVIHTVTPAAPERDLMAVSAAWGLGPTVVQGSGPADSFELSRDPIPRVLSRHIVSKESALASREGAGTEPALVPAGDRATACVSDEELVRLGKIALTIERHAGRYQEIEWSVRKDGEVVILQARGLRAAPSQVRDGAELARLLAGHRAVFRGRGVIACGGVGAGPVVRLRSPDDADGFPSGAVLVAQTPSPQFAPLLARASGVITEVGSATGHLATVAREYRVPMVVAVPEATEVLQPGMTVTIDAEENVVYDGVVHELLRYHLSHPDPTADFEEFRLLRRLLRRIAPLNLSDPNAENFRARYCTTCHDVIRFAHEMAVRELVDMPGLSARERRRFVRRLRLPIPMDLDVIDLGGGIARRATGRLVDPEDIESAPLAAMLHTLCATWQTEPVDIDMGSLLSSATTASSLTVTGGSKVRPNLAVVTKDYTNLHLHLGYHFNMVDCRLTEIEALNHLYFRFFGGVTEITRRSRRARTIAAILEEHGFGVETREDLVVGRLRNVAAPAMRETLHMVGRLIGYTRQLDVLMRHEGTVREFARAFSAGQAGPVDQVPTPVRSTVTKDTDSP